MIDAATAGGNKSLQDGSRARIDLKNVVFRIAGNVNIAVGSEDKNTGIAVG